MNATLRIARAALDAALAAGQQALPREIGGILLGFRTPQAVVITRVLVVPDPRSSHCTYLRHRGLAQALMEAAFADAPRVVGYVGEWHTHPNDVPPSRADRRAIGATARLATGPVALLVLAYPATGPARLCGIVAQARSRPVPVIRQMGLKLADVQPVEDTPDSLEAEAVTLLTPPEEEPR